MVSFKTLRKFFGFGSLGIAFILILFLYFLNNSYESLDIKNNFIPLDNKTLHVKDVTGKSLLLDPLKFDTSFHFLKEDLMVYVHAPRPDFDQKEKKLEIKIKSLNTSKIIKPNQRVFLKLNDNNLCDFSETPSNFWIDLILNDLGNIRIDVGCDFNNLKDIQIKKMDSYLINAVDGSLQEDARTPESIFKILSSAQWYKPDLFIQIINDDDCLANKQRLDIDGSILHIDQGDLLIYKDEKWQLGDIETKGHKLAKIKSIDEKIIEIEAWNELGDKKYLFVISSHPESVTNFKIDDLISSARRRTRSHVSCIIEKQRFVLKEKDILIKKSGRWKLVKKDSVLKDVGIGEMFYFDKIEDNKYLKGYLFNPLRTQIINFNVAISSVNRTRSHRNQKGMK